MCTQKNNNNNNQVFYRRFVFLFFFLWTPREYSGARFWRIACSWIISQERSWISIMRSKGLHTPTTRRRIPSHSIDHNSLISASLSKASLNSNAWTPELQIHTLFSLVSHLHLSESANFCSQLPTVWAVDRSGLTCLTSLILATHHNGKTRPVLRAAYASALEGTVYRN